MNQDFFVYKVSQLFWVLENDLSGLWKVSDMTPSWNGEFSSKSKLILELIS